jgi:phosphoribosylformylglycinamidine synthase
VLVLLGATRDELGGSEWAHETHGHLGGRPPAVDLGAERRLAELLVAFAHQGLVAAAHDVSVGGLVQTLAEMAMRGDAGLGAAIQLPAGLDPFVALFSESAARAVLAVRPDDVEQVVALAAAGGVPVERIGRVGGSALDVVGWFEVEVAELRAASEAVLPALFS